MPPFPDDTLELIAQADARRAAFREAESAWRDTERSVGEVENDLARDLGDDEQFHGVEGECFTLETREYVYTLCPFKEVTQKQLSGGGSTLLGRWAGWGESEEEAEARAPGRFARMRFTGGVRCWGGPDRSAVVAVRCGAENRLSNVDEPEKCTYTLDLETPAACHGDLPAEHRQYLPHDEL